MKTSLVVSAFLLLVVGCGGDAGDPTGSFQAAVLCGANQCSPVVLASGQSDPVNVAVQGNNIVFDTISTISSVPKAGGAVSILASGLGDTTGITVSGAFTYWTSAGPQEFKPADDGFVARVKTGQQAHIISAPSAEADPFGPSAGGGFVYWADFTEGAVKRIDISTQDESVFSANEPGAIRTAADANGAAWIDYFPLASPAIRVATHTGAPITAAIDPLTDGSTPFDLALDATHVYWVSNNDSGKPGHLYRVTRTAPFVVQHLGSDPDSANGLDVDGQNVYWTAGDFSAGQRVNRTPIAGGATTTIYTGPAYGIAVDGQAVYWTDVFGGNVMKMSKSVP